MASSGRLLSFVILFASAAPALACTCGKATRAEIVRDSDIVFRGQVMTAETSGRQHVARFRVLQKIKGDAGGTVEVRSRLGIGSCGVSFQAGQSLTVAANARDGYYSTSRCMLRALGR